MLNIFGVPMDPVSQLTTFSPTVLIYDYSSFAFDKSDNVGTHGVDISKKLVHDFNVNMYIYHTCIAVMHSPSQQLRCLEETPMQLVFQYICQVAKYIRYAKLNSALSC